MSGDLEAQKMAWYRSGDISPLLGVPQQKTVALDTETTGLNPRRDEILEVAIVRGDGECLLNERVRPVRIYSWPKAQAVHGIAPSDVEGLDTIAAIANRIGEILQSSRLIVGYNLPFDLAFLSAAGVRIPSCAQFDVMREFAPVANRWDPRKKSYRWVSLEKCARHYHVQYIPHGAAEDALASLGCYKKMLCDDGSDYRSVSTVPYLEVCMRRHER